MRQAIYVQARKHRVPIRLVTRRMVEMGFKEAAENKYAIASIIAQTLPELASRLPRQRKIWEGEDYRMSIFDAAAAGLAYFRAQEYGAQPALDAV